MSRLIALYPAAWRDRYELEFRTLMAERPPNRRDRLDIVRGAVDAHFHPQVPGGPEERWQASRAARLTGGLVVVAGSAWTAWLGLILRDFRGWGAGMPATADLMIVLSFVGFVALTLAVVAIAVTFGSTIRPIGRLGVMLATLGFVITTLGGGISITVAFIGVAILAGSMSDCVISRWLAVGWIGTTVLAFLAVIAFVAGEGRDVGLLLLGIPFGIAWLIVGATIAVRGAMPRVELPVTKQ